MTTSTVTDSGEGWSRLLDQADADYQRNCSVQPLLSNLEVSDFYTKIGRDGATLVFVSTTDNRFSVYQVDGDSLRLLKTSPIWADSDDFFNL